MSFYCSTQVSRIDYSTSPTIGSTITLSNEIGNYVRTYEFDAKLPAGSAKALFSFGGSNAIGGVIDITTQKFVLFANWHAIVDANVSLPSDRHIYTVALGQNSVRLYMDRTLQYSYTAMPTAAMLVNRSFVFGTNQSDTSEKWGGTLYALAVADSNDVVFTL